MGNTRKPNNPELRIAADGIPEENEKVVLQEVPANLKWADVEGIDRDDVETIGKQIIYDDGSTDLLVDWESISEDAKKLLGYYTNQGPYSIAEPN